MFPKIVVPQNEWFKNPIKMDDLGVPLFLETPIYIYVYIYMYIIYIVYLSVDISSPNCDPRGHPFCKRPKEEASRNCPDPKACSVPWRKDNGMI